MCCFGYCLAFDFVLLVLMRFCCLLSCCFDGVLGFIGIGCLLWFGLRVGCVVCLVVGLLVFVGLAEFSVCYLR